MKWSDLSFKEKKQIYDSIKAQNPDTTYLDIKSQFDSIPAYEDGGKKIMPPKELGLTPGTPEYYKRQQQISGKASTVQPEAYITPAGYVKDAINFVEDLSNGDYTGAASKSHMLTLKRALKDSNKISKWSDPVDENMILDYFRSGRANGAVRNQYDLYIDKQRYIDRLNRLVPMEWLLPTIGLGGAEFLREKQNNKSN